MALRFVIQEVVIETVKKGPRSYQTASVVHTYNGNSRTQKIVSFANPETFKTVSQLKAGDVIDVDVTKNEGGFNQWAKITRVSEEELETGQPDSAVVATRAAAPSSGKVVGSNYETREERAARQVLIVRQSCLAQSVMVHKDDVFDVDTVLQTAQTFVDWVFEKPDLFDQPNDLDKTNTDK
jgi:hypothetical protein